MAKTPTVTYTVVEAIGPIEIRDYGPLWVAEATTSGERQKAITEGFQTLANFIFGANQEGRRVAMTAPVTQEPQLCDPSGASDASSIWRTRFFMPPAPPGETEIEPPVPFDDKILVFRTPPQRIAAIRFSGAARSQQLDRKAAELSDRLKQAEIQTEGGPIYAFYNSPLRPPFLRRNEVMFRIGASARIAV